MFFNINKIKKLYLTLLINVSTLIIVSIAQIKKICFKYRLVFISIKINCIGEYYA